MLTKEQLEQLPEGARAEMKSDGGNQHAQIGAMVEWLATVDRLDAAESAMALKRAAIIAIHWRTQYFPIDAAAMKSIRDICEHVMPELNPSKENCDGA